MKTDPSLTAALRQVVDKIDASVRASGYTGEPIQMYLAGGLAAHYYSSVRYTRDIDASFSKRLLLSPKELTASFIQEGKPAILHFDANYNPDFALMHPDYQKDSREWKGLGNEQRIVKLNVLSPLDLAVSKLSRFSEQDQRDIQALARDRLISVDALRQRATEALEYYVGNKATLLGHLETAFADIARETSRTSEKPTGRRMGI